MAKHEVRFSSCIDGEPSYIGHGVLVSERVYLRVERIEDRINALCSPDGEEWFTVGHVTFPAKAQLEVGLCAIGLILRQIHPGAYPDGTAIRFESFQLWQP